MFKFIFVYIHIKLKIKFNMVNYFFKLRYYTIKTEYLTLNRTLFVSNFTINDLKIELIIGIFLLNLKLTRISFLEKTRKCLSTRKTYLYVVFSILLTIRKTNPIIFAFHFAIFLEQKKHSTSMNLYFIFHFKNKIPKKSAKNQ